MLRTIVSSYRQAFAGLPRQVWILAGCLFVNRLGMMVLPFLELYLTGERGFAVDAGGRLVALYGVGSILGVTAGGWLTDRFGPWRVQVASLVGSALTLVLLWQARGALAIGAAITAAGFVSDAFRPANGAAITAAVGTEARARAFSLMSLAVNLGLSLGLPLAGMLARIDFDWLFWIDAGTALGAAVVLASLAERTRVPTRAEHSAARALAPSPWGDRFFLGVMVLHCLSATVLFQFFGALPVFLKHDLGFDEAGVGLALALNTIVTAAFGMLAVRWVERRAELVWIGVGSALICVGYGVNGLTGLFGVFEGGGATGLALASIVVWSVGEMFFFPLGASFVTRRAPATAVGRYLSVYHLGFALAFVFAPLVGTALYEGAGPRGLWSACALVGVSVGAAYGLAARHSAAEKRREEARLEPGGPGVDQRRGGSL